MSALVTVPTRGVIGWQTVTRLQEIRDRHPGLPPIVYQPGNLSVALTRNTIVKKFLAGPWQLLVMVDDDVVPPPTMLDTFNDMPSGFGVGAIPHVMPHPVTPAELALTAFTDDGGLRVAQLEDGWNEVDAVATGCVAISRAALVACGPNPFRIENNPDAQVTSDDFLFCQDVKNAGFKIGAYMDGWYCDHITAVSLAPLYEHQTERETSWTA